jgi:uncharacterized membrane protein
MERKEKPSEETKKRWHADPNNWFLVLFYFNREDKRIFPPKRIAWMGWTINFANPISVGVLLFFLVLLLKVISLK